ncbi:MAG: SHOCT domain-containing protein [Chloroflexi bacterium]|nr:MAG: SHOCT domain-containing protein [Chloroflexota bacterium]
MPMFGAGGGMMLLFALVPVALLALLVWAVRGQRSSPARGDALAILQRRYAAGEIQREEYERIRTDLLRDRG